MMHQALRPATRLLAKYLFVALLASSLSGCVFIGRQGDFLIPDRCTIETPYTYGGVMTHGKILWWFVSDWEGEAGYIPFKALIFVFATIDFPFTLVADTLHLPFSVRQDYKRHKECRGKKAKPDNSSTDYEPMKKDRPPKTTNRQTSD